MEPNKFDKNIKEKFEERTLLPSEKAWDRLDAMLTVAENESQKRKVNWLAIAAVFLGFIFVGVVMFTSQTNSKFNTNPIVIENNSSKEVIQNENIENQIINQEQSITREKQPLVQIKKSNQTIKKQHKTKNEVISQAIENQSKVNFDNEIEFQTQEVIVQSELPKVKLEKNNKVTIDPKKLLASIDSQQKNTLKTEKIKVNPSHLLSDIDDEFNQTFREKAINKISSSFQTVKVAVINRNLE